METTINQYKKTTRKELQHLNILYVGSEITSKRNFRKDLCENYQFFLTASGPEALRILDEFKVHLLIIELAINDMCSIELLQRAVSSNPEMAKIIIAYKNDTDQIIKAVNSVKIDKCLARPWKQSELEQFIDQELSKFHPADPLSSDDLPHIKFQSRIGDEELAENYSFGDPLSDIFKNSFEIKNYPQKNQSNFQWVGKAGDGHEVVLLLNIIHIDGLEEFEKSISRSMENIISENPESWQLFVQEQIQKCYWDFLKKAGVISGETPDLNICALFIHDEEDSVRYITNYHGIKLFDLSLNEIMVSGCGTCSLGDLSRIFMYSKSFNEHCLGDLTYSQLINESIEMDLDRQGHFLEMEILKSSLITKNISIVGIALN